MDSRKEIRKMVIKLGGVMRTADLLECSRGSVYNWINGKRSPTLDVFIELCEYADKEITVKTKEVDYFSKRR